MPRAIIMVWLLLVLVVQRRARASALLAFVLGHLGRNSASDGVGVLPRGGMYVDGDIGGRSLHHGRRYTGRQRWATVDLRHVGKGRRAASQAKAHRAGSGQALGGTGQLRQRAALTGSKALLEAGHGVATEA